MSVKPAVEGGRPVRAKFLPFHRPPITNAEVQAAVRALRSGWLTMGPRTQEFEERFRAYVGAKHAVAVSSCTAGLHATLAAVGVGPRDEVLTSPLTFTSTASVAVHLGARPVFADIDGETFNLDPEAAERKIGPKTKAMIPVHHGGLPCDLDVLGAMARANGTFLLEDAAHAFGASYRGTRIGAVGDATAFSFYATKPLTTGEGGMVTTDDGALADRLRSLRLHGISRDAWKRYAATGDWYYEVLEAGYKYNMTDVQAAIGLVQLRRAETLFRKRRSAARYLTKGLGGLATVTLPREPKGSVHAWHLYPILLDVDRLRIDRARFIEAMRAENIGTSVHFIPLHLQPFYQKRFGYRRGDFPVAERVYDRIVSLPLYPDLTRADLDDVVEAVAKIVAHYGG